MHRKQFTFYRSFWESIRNLPTNKEKLQAFELLCSYALDYEEPDLSAVKSGAATVFTLARPVLETARNRAMQAQAANRLKQLADGYGEILPKQE